MTHLSEHEVQLSTIPINVDERFISININSYFKYSYVQLFNIFSVYLKESKFFRSVIRPKEHVVVELS